MVFNIRSSLAVRWDIWGRRRWDWGARNVHSRADPVQLGLHLDWGGGFTGIGRECVSETTCPGIFLWTPFSVVLSSSIPQSLPMVTFGLPDLLVLFFRGCTNCIKPVFCSGRWNAWRPRSSSKWSLQWLDQKLRACITSSEGPWPGQSPPCQLAHLQQKAQVGAYYCGLMPNSPKLPHLSPPTQGGNIATEMAPLHVNVGDVHQVYHCQVKGYPEGPLYSYATICSHVHGTHLAIKLSCLLCPITFFNTDAFRPHGKWAHCSGSSDST